MSTIRVSGWVNKANWGFIGACIEKWGATSAAPRKGEAIALPAGLLLHVFHVA